MRELKFRAWGKRVKIMGKPFNFEILIETVLKDTLGTTIDMSYFDEMELMQYTGLKDKNDKEIYEGDLLVENEYDKEAYAIYEIFFHDGDEANHHIGFQMNRVHYKGRLCGGYIPNFLPKTTKRMEVIGNIYENKDLIV